MDFDINIDLWVYKSNGELIEKFNASVLTDRTILSIMNDIDEYIKENKDEQKNYWNTNSCGVE